MYIDTHTLRAFGDKKTKLYDRVWFYYVGKDFSHFPDYQF